MDISSLRERDNVNAFTVSELNNYIKNIFENNRTLTALTVRGEISNFTNHYKSGHFYFTIKDETSCMHRDLRHRYLCHPTSIQLYFS